MAVVDSAPAREDAPDGRTPLGVERRRDRRWSRYLAPAVLALALAVPAALAAPAAQAQQVAQLARLDVQIWPEYDRADAALIILRAELAADVPLPASLSLSIPASAGSPFAVASAASAGGELLNLEYETSAAGDAVQVQMTTANRFVQLEFYEPLGAPTPDRAYTYVWRGDLAADQLVVQLQEPAGATEVAVQPELGPGSAAPDGLTYRSAPLGPVEAGETLTVEVRYRKSDARPSAEILGLVQAPGDQPAQERAGDGISGWVLHLLLVPLVVAASAAAGYALARNRLGAARAVPAGPRQGPRPSRGTSGGRLFCTQCGRELSADDRFCAGCGGAVQRRGP